ncbi:MAG TPA: acylphosphatase [Anaerolineae bacterium]|nr:acylphosphatase [Anaerolineae bacterium]
MAATRAHLWITGLVQGVNFRYYTRAEALRLHLTGWVRNLWDGRVEAVFEGEEESVRKMVEWCHVGPPSARVVDVEIEWETPLGNFNDFDIRMSGRGG